MANEVHDAPHARYLQDLLDTVSMQGAGGGSEVKLHRVNLDRMRDVLADYRNTWHARNDLERRLQLQHKRTDLAAAALTGLASGWMTAGTQPTARAAIALADAMLEQLRESEPKRRQADQVNDDPADLFALVIELQDAGIAHGLTLAKRGVEAYGGLPLDNSRDTQQRVITARRALLQALGAGL